MKLSKQRMQHLAGLTENSVTLAGKKYNSLAVVNRMEELANTQDLDVFKAKLRMLVTDWLKEGFDPEDIAGYVEDLINQV